MKGFKRPGSLSLKIALTYFLLILLAAVIEAILLTVGLSLLVSTVVSLVITVVIIFFVSERISRRMTHLIKEAEAMLEGDFSREIVVDANDEVGELADVYNKLRIELNDTLVESANEKNKLQTILKHMAEGVIVVDLTCNIIHTNPAAETMLKISESDKERLSYDEIISKYNDELILRKIMIATEEEAIQDEFVYGGATFSVWYDRFKDEEDNIIGMIVIIQDITERLKIENMQTDFVANISHELKTPLTTIKSYTETLLEDGVEHPETAREFLSIIDSEIDRMNRLVKDLLQLSRLNYKQQKWYKKEGDLITLVNTAVKKMHMTAKSKDQQVNILFNSDMPIMVDMDRDRIEQVILNVLSNAIKYTKEKGRIDVDIIKREKTVDVIILDNGRGIPEKQLSRVFERFFRVDKARSRSMGGTGLGLSISKQIIEEHKGDISMESKFGRGTKVTISLPLAPIRGRRNIL